MASVWAWLGNNFTCVVALFIFTTASCEEKQPRIDPADLDSQNPFGFSWHSYDGQGEQIGDHWAECRELVAQLGGLIAPTESEYFVKKCAKEKHTIIFVPSDRLSSSLRQGELGVVLRGESEPVLYNYSFLHRVLPNDDRKNKIQRREHASAIRRELNNIYGLPATAGYYDQSSETGFVVAGDKERPCEFWLEENVGIMLCSERVILIDGIEMALSFIKLDRVPYGHALRCMVDPKSAEVCGDTSEHNSNKLTAKSVSFLEILANWLGPDNFRDCQSDNLEPIEKVWTLSETEKFKLAVVLETHSGEELALYTINYAEGPGSEIPTRTRDKILMFLFERAAAQGSATAMNEIGASLLYCYQHVQQDAKAAQNWLEKAALGGDTLAMKSLALMHLSGMTETINPSQEAVRLLEQCSRLDAELCSDESMALNTFTASQDE
jgi:hypothetical protein